MPTIATSETTKQDGYVILHNAGSASDVKGYVVYRDDDVGVSKGYVVAGNSGAINVRGYALLAAPATSAKNTAYPILTSAGSATFVHGYAVLAPFYPPLEDLDFNASFVEQRFPECASFGGSGGPGWKTSIFELDSGYTAVTMEWEELRAKYNVNINNATPTDIQDVEKFFYSVLGMGYGFRYKDWSDYYISNQNIFVADGVATEYQIFKRYSSGGYVFDRIIKKTVNGSLTDFTLDGEALVFNRDYYLRDTLGTIVFTTAPPAGSVGKIGYCEFDVPVRFDTDYLSVSYDEHNKFAIPALPMVEILI